MILKDIQHIYHKELDTIYGIEEVDSFFYLLIDYYLDLNRMTLALEPRLVITKEDEQPLFEALSKLKLQEPIQHIIGKTEFYGLPFKVNKHTLIPRPETEELVDWILKCHAGRSEESSLKILDMGTGTGCIAISLAKNLPNAKVYALDVSEEALKIAKQNAEINSVDVSFIHDNILQSCFTESQFDIIVSNPPYVRNLEKKEIKPNVLNNEPHLALFVADDNPLQFYEAITEFAVNNLKDEGMLYFEINQYLGNEMKQLLVSHNFKNIELKKDLFGNDRMIKGLKI